MMYAARLKTPFGTWKICATETHIVKIKPCEDTAEPDGNEPQPPPLRQGIVQLREYFDGKRQHFELPLAPQGTAFQTAVWQALQTIPYGETRTYGDIAIQVGNPKAARAVGMANHRNPLSIVIPCHRVIGADGSLTGYASGLEIKRVLLDLEKVFYKFRNGSIEGAPALAGEPKPNR